MGWDLFLAFFISVFFTFLGCLWARLYLLSVLLMLEVLSFLIFIYFFLFLVLWVSYLGYIFFMVLFGVCEACMGLSLMILFSRVYGSNYLNMINLF
uniref:NADH dehydrogenase subunit 4L n=1 Tax=Semnoderes armiger TaxID=1415233 RepID=A0A5H2Q9Q7_9BILA|nr:NADH dehydrogenase subunit 4L [Semnoderes armiger]AYF57118.1 NADH dehydrogenase subunit 4L [Semnoderes armiger]